MKNNEPQEKRDDQVVQSSAETTTLGPAAEWEKRKIVLRRIRYESSTVPRIRRVNRDPNCLKSNYRGVLSILRAEALKEVANTRTEIDSQTDAQDSIKKAD